MPDWEQALLSSSGRGAREIGVSIAAIVVTFNRAKLLKHWLQCLTSQSVPLQEIIVVDNSSYDETETVIAQEYPWVTYLRMTDNIGPGGAWAAGMQAAYKHGHDWFWVFNDDSFPGPEVLAQLLQRAIEHFPKVGMIAPVAQDNGQSFCGVIWKGRWVPTPVPRQSSGWFFVDGVTFAGVLISKEVAADIGYPRGDFFFMFEEYEYCFRARRAGYQIAVLSDVFVSHMHAGSTGKSPPWRGYYQTRNHLAIALEHHSSRELFWWSLKLIKYCLGAILYLDSKPQRIRLRLLGAWHGFRGRLGKTIDPAAFPN